MTRYGVIAGLINGLRSPQDSIELHTTIYFPLRRECRIAPTVPVCSCAFFYVQFAHEIAGAACTRCSLRPLIFEGNFLHNSGASCRETADAYRRGCLKSQIGNL